MVSRYCSREYFGFNQTVEDTLNVKIKKNVLNYICSQHENPPLCLQSFKSDPLTASVNLVVLTNISIHITDTVANKTLTLIASLVNKTADPKLKV